MASSALLSLLLITTTTAALAALSRAAHLDSSSTASFQWPLTSATLFDNLDLDFDTDTDLDIDLDADADTISDRRALYWRRGAGSRYYISYGALSANRIPCPPRSGRSYYTQNCFKARGPVRPYSRGCSAITRCRR